MEVSTVRIHKKDYDKASAFCRRVSYLAGEKMTQPDTFERVLEMLQRLPDDTVLKELRLGSN